MGADHDAIELERIDRGWNCYRYYRMALAPDLFGGIALVRHWGRIGSAGQQRLDLFVDHAGAIFAMHKLATAKRRRGYTDQPCDA